MTLILELEPEVEARLESEAARCGMIPADYAKQLLAQHLPEQSVQTLAELMQQWSEEDATDDPEELARRDAEWEELQANLRANRITFPVPEV